MLRYALAFLLASPALADVDSAVEVILPDYTTFSAAADALSLAAQVDCRPDALKPAYNATFDAWLGVAHLRLGPAEVAAPSIAFWPDTRGTIPKALSRMIAVEDDIINGDYREVSIAARGLFALEAMLYGEFSEYEDGSYSCDLVQAIAVDLAEQATALEHTWRDGYAKTLRTGGAPENSTYLSSEESLRALYTQLLGGLEFIADQRLGRPMGTFDRPRPTRAEAWRSGRSSRNIYLSLQALRALAFALSDEPTPRTNAAFAAAISEASRPIDPGFQAVTDPQGRLRLESLQTRVREIYAAIEEEIGKPLGIAPGFNSLDGD